MHLKVPPNLVDNIFEMGGPDILRFDLGGDDVRTAKHIKKNLFERLSEENDDQEAPPSLIWEAKGRQAQHLKQFFNTAEHRKRQILEKMLMD